MTIKSSYKNGLLVVKMAYSECRIDLIEALAPKGMQDKESIMSVRYG